MAAATDSMAAHDQQGFTLVELLVVLSLIAVATTAVVLTLRPGGADARSEATQLAVRAAALRDRAVVQGHSVGLWVTASGYGFEQRVGGDWRPLRDGRLSRRDWTAGTAASVNGASSGRLAFDRFGLPDQAMRIDVTVADTTAAVVIDAGGDVVVR